MTLSAGFQGGEVTPLFAIGFMYTPQIARIVRANIVSEYGEDYVRATIVSGARAPDISQGIEDR